MAGYEWFALVGGTVIMMSLAILVWKITSH
jgi:hypothetical protein